MQQNILLLGLGNLLLRDDGLGIRALELLQDRYDLPDEVDCVDGGVLGLELMAHVEGRTHLLAIDAVQTGQAAGTLVRLEGEEIPKGLTVKLSMHQVTFADIMALSALRGTLPPRLVVWGVVPEILESGVGLTPVVEAQLGGLVNAVVGELESWGIKASPNPNSNGSTAMEQMLKRGRTPSL
ncbi:MAG: HyaD/HybD family hydrogenase maturation endopeptidase [Candidatus Methylumidiphilus sp.]